MPNEIAPGHAKAAGIVGIFILILALVDFIVGIIWATYGGKDAAGIWCGLLLMLTGILGVVTWPKKNKITMVFFMVLCIIDIICCIVQAALAALGFLIWQILKAIISTKCTIRGGHCDCAGNNIPVELEDCSWISAIEIIFLVLLIVNGVAVIFVFAGSIIGCAGTCCASNPQQTGVIMVQQPGPAVIIQQQAYPGQAQQQPYPGQAQQGGPPPTYAQQTVPPGQYPMSEAIPPKDDIQTIN